LQRSNRKGRPGWLRSLMEFFGVGKQQEAAAIVAAVKAVKPVGRRETDRRMPMACVVTDDEML
jgi:hypothetical protein